MEPAWMSQIAPYPNGLYQLINSIRYKKGWRFTLYDDYLRDPPSTHSGESRGLTLSILIDTPDSYHPENMIRVQHLFPVPPATYNHESWQRWLLDRILQVEQHEACEFFTITEPELIKPFAPLHGPGEDPYRIVEYATNKQRRTSFQGKVEPNREEIDHGTTEAG